MSQPVVEAEAALVLCLVEMRDALAAALDGALPRTHYEGEADGDGVPDTLRQRLTWEQEHEYARVRPRAALVQERLAALRARVAALGGGGDPATGAPAEVPVAVLDRDIEALAAESARCAAEMIALYDRAERMAADLQRAIAHAPVPPVV